MYTQYQHIRHKTYNSYILAQGYCDFQESIDNGAYAPDFDSDDMEVVMGAPDPSSLQWQSFPGIKNSILYNINAHFLKAFAELKVLVPDPTARSAILQQLTNLKPTFEMQDSELMSAYIQSCIDTPLVADPTLNQQLINVIKKYFDFDYMQTDLSFEDLQLLGVFT
jgi:hypothetical protein